MHQATSLLELLKALGRSCSLTRYVLLKLAFRAWKNEPIDVGNQGLAAVCGVSVAQLIEAKKALIAAGILFEKTEVTSERRRPKQLLDWMPEHSRDQVAQMVSGSRCAPVLATLLNLRGRVPRLEDSEEVVAVGSAGWLLKGKREQKISAVNCLMLAVLWLHADEFGVVERIGAKEH